MNIEQRTEKTAFLFEQKPYKSILSALGEGAGQGIHARELTKLTGIQDRDLRALIEFLRQNGLVICGDVNGYYWPESVTSISKYITQESRRAKTTFYNLKSARSLLKNLTPLEVGE